MKAEQKVNRRFPNPFEVEPPVGAEDWRRLYPYYYLFSDDRRDFEEGKFWFFDGMHNPEPMYPFDTIMTETWWVALNQYTTRVWLVPTALGIDHRVVNGYLYISPNTISDPALIEQRAAHFRERAGYYFEHWDEMYANWIKKAEDVIQRLIAIEIRDLPEMEPMETITSGRGLMSSYDLLHNYSALLDNMHEIGYLHFEMLGLGYGAYLTFKEFCEKAFPGITDQAIAKMVSGIDILFFRPDDELRNLAVLGIESQLSDILRSGRPPEEILKEIASRPHGRGWLEAFENAKDPWFWFSTGPGYCHQHRAWIDDLTVPFQAIHGYIEKLELGEDIHRPLEHILEERERITREYRELLPTDTDRKAFDDLVNLARTVYPFVENHNFYVEHWHHSIFWNKVRDLGRVLVNHGFLEDAEDVFFLHRYELYEALYDLLSEWATMTPARGPHHWPKEVAERKRIMDSLRAWSPPPALGVPPETVNEPFTIMLWGITTDTVNTWLGAEDGDGASNELLGFAGSPGVAEGPARVITAVEQLSEVQTGEILICPITAPSWAPVFARIKAAVSDIGGIMCHAAIVSREYGLPAVVGTGYATKRIKTGQMVRVDGNMGIVTILES
jgi:pyruvate,water dikinase